MEKKSLPAILWLNHSILTLMKMPLIFEAEERFWHSFRHFCTWLTGHQQLSWQMLEHASCIYIYNNMYSIFLFKTDDSFSCLQHISFFLSDFLSSGRYSKIYMVIVLALLSKNLVGKTCMMLIQHSQKITD